MIEKLKFYFKIRKRPVYLQVELSEATIAFVSLIIAYWRWCQWAL